LKARATSRPGPRRITFLTNPDDCNLACPMCREHSPLATGRDKPRRLTIDFVASVLGERADSPLEEVIPSTMGEPLLWPGIDRLAELCSERNLLLNVTTNGTFPDRGATSWAKLLAPIASDVKVSWNAASAATAARVAPGLDFARAIEAVRDFVGVRDELRARGQRACRVSFQVTAQEANVAELPRIVELAAQLGIERVKVNQLQVHFSALMEQDLRRHPAARERWNEAVGAMCAAAQTHPLPSGRTLLLENAEPWREGAPPARGPCPFLDREAWVLGDGRFAPCPAPAGQDGKLGVFGSLAEHGMGEIWLSHEYRALVRGYLAHATCSNCALRRAGGR